MAPARLRFWLLAVAALAAGLALRLWFIAHQARIAGDTLVYGDIARNLLEHHVYGFTAAIGPPRPTLIRLPGYPLFLAACFRIFGMEHYHAVLYIQCAADLLTCIVLAVLAGRLFAPAQSGTSSFATRPALATLWLACLCPFTASYVAAPLTETLTLLTIAIAYFSLERWQAAIFEAAASRTVPPASTRIQSTPPTLNHWLFLTAAAIAYSILLRPDQGLLAAAILPAIFWISHRNSTTHPVSLRQVATPVLIAAICILAPLLPWTLRNYHTFHLFQPLAPRFANDPGEPVPTGFQRWYRTWAIDFISTDNAYWKYDGDTINIADLPTRAFDTEDQYDETAALLDDYNDTTTASPALDRRFERIAGQRIHTDPIRYYLALPVARLLNMIFRPRTEMLPLPLDWWHWCTHPRKSALVTILAILNCVYVTLAVIGSKRWFRGIRNHKDHNQTPQSQTSHDDRHNNFPEPGNCYHDEHNQAEITGNRYNDRYTLSSEEENSHHNRHNQPVAHTHSSASVVVATPGAANHVFAGSLLAFVILRCALLLTIDNSEPRYTLEFFPILLIAAAALFAPVPHPDPRYPVPATSRIKA